VINIEFIRQIGFSKWAVRYFILQFKKQILKQGVNLKLPSGLNYYAPIWDPSATEVLHSQCLHCLGAKKILVSILDKKNDLLNRLSGDE